MNLSVAECCRPASDGLKQLPRQFQEVVKDGYRPLTIHRHHPRGTLGGILGLFSFESDYVSELIEQGFQDAVTHDGHESKCVFPTWDGVMNARQGAHERKAAARPAS